MLEQERLTRQGLLPGSGSDPDVVRKMNLGTLNAGVLTSAAVTCRISRTLFSGMA